MSVLSQLAIHESAIIENVGGDSSHAMRLIALGFTPGSVVSAVKESVFGGPRVFSVHGGDIALREFDADLIHVRLK
ncbi:ferrous iron transport protein A [bacterium]|nr:ferrous iron transport protein A [bacterium]